MSYKLIVLAVSAATGLTVCASAAMVLDLLGAIRLHRGLDLVGCDRRRERRARGRHRRWRIGPAVPTMPAAAMRGHVLLACCVPRY